MKRIKKQRTQPVKELNLDASFSCKKEKSKKERKKERNEAYGQAYAYHGCDANQLRLTEAFEMIDDDFGSLSGDSDS